MATIQEVIRTFLAVYPAPDALRRVAGVIDSFRGRTEAIRWTPEHQLHFTLRFFGDLDVAARRKIVGVLESTAPRLSPVSFPLNGIGAFPNWRRPRVLWVGAGAGGEDLENIARRLDIAFAEAGLGRADKPFRAHLTVGRIREGRPLSPEIQRDLERLPFSTPPLRVGSLRLMGSRLGPKGATHTELCEVPLGTES